MPAYTTYPTDADLEAFLSNLSLPVPPGLDLEAKIAAAIADWETATGWRPYLAARDADGNPLATTRLFDPPGSSGAGRSSPGRGARCLYLRAGLLSLTSLAVGVVPDPTGNYTDGIGTAGTLLTQNLNFYLRPQDAGYRGEGFTEVEFLSPIRGVPQSVAVTGVWGRTLTLPGDVREAILQMAAMQCVPEMQMALSNGLVKIDDVQFVTGDSSPLFVIAEQWKASSRSLIQRKKRMVA